MRCPKECIAHKFVRTENEGFYYCVRLNKKCREIWYCPTNPIIGEGVFFKTFSKKIIKELTEKGIIKEN